MKHIMIDIETMSSQANAAIISIGLAEFDPKSGEITRQLEVRNTFEAQQTEGRHFSPDTVEWWLRQSRDAQQALLAKPRHDTAKGMMAAVSAWILEAHSSQWERGLWAKGPTFDLKLMRHHYEELALPCPWHFSREYCVRTMLMIAKANGWDDILAMEPEVAHGALSDAIHQAVQVMAVMERLKK